MRNGIRRVIAALVIFVALGDGADALFETRDAKLQAVKTVGVISAIGDQFTLAKGGLTGPDDGSRNFSIAAWGLDSELHHDTSICAENLNSGRTDSGSSRLFIVRLMFGPRTWR